MRKIPLELRQELENDPYYRKCCLTGLSKNIKIDWHHAWLYAGKQINEKWAIMPVWNRKHNFNGDTDSVHNCNETKEKVKLMSLLRADLDDLAKRYPKKNWSQELEYLNNKFNKNV